MVQEQEPWTEVVKAVGPAIGWSSLHVALLTGAGGLAFGGIAGTVRRTTPLLFAFGSGVQFAAIGGCFSAVRSFSKVWLSRQRGSGVQDLSRKDHVKISTVAGAITGGTTGMLFRGRSNVVPGMIVFTILGFTGQQVVNFADRRRGLAPSEEHIGLFERVINSKYMPFKKLSDEEYKGILDERLVRVEAEIALVDDSIAALKSPSQTSQSDRKIEKDPS